MHLLLALAQSFGGRPVSIVDYNRHSPTIDPKFPPNTPTDRFIWLSTSDALKNAQHQPDIYLSPPLPLNPPRKHERLADHDTIDYGNEVGRAVEFIFGLAWQYSKDQEFYVRCVRYAD